MPLPQPANRDQEELMDMLAYILATSPATQNITWILGDIGMGAPTKVPFGYISVLNELQRWETSRGGTGGLASSVTGVDDWQLPIVMTVAFAPHQYVPPVAARPPQGSALYPPSLSLSSLPYLEQPGWRTHLQIIQQVKGVLRTNAVIGGEAAATRVTESRYVLQMVEGKLYRASRVTLQTQQRRQRGT